MSPPVAPASKPPVIPAPPRMEHRRRESDRRALIWLAALVVGVAAGMSSHKWIDPATRFFDYWIARLW
jgi:hypothetical protein